MNAPDWMPAKSMHPREQQVAHRIGHRSLKVASEQLDPGDLAVVAHPAVGEAEVAHGPLGPVDLAQPLGRYRLVVGDARGQARRGWLVGHGQVQVPGHLTDLHLGQASRRQGPQHVVLGRRARSWPVDTLGVIGVLAVGDCCQPLDRRHLCRDGREKLVLAVIAPVGTVGPVCRSVTFPSDHLDQPGADELGCRLGCAAFVVGQAG